MEITDIIRDLEAAAKSRGLSVDDLCKEIPINRTTWQRWKSGKFSPDLDALKRAATVLDLKVDITFSSIDGGQAA